MGLNYKYKNLSLAQLTAKYNEKRRRIAELPESDRLPSDMEELLSMRREIDLRERDTKHIVNVDFTETYVTK